MNNWGELVSSIASSRNSKKFRKFWYHVGNFQFCLLGATLLGVALSKVAADNCQLLPYNNVN